MTLTWTDLTNGISNLLFRTNINTFNGNVRDQVNTNTTDIATNASGIATNSSNITALDSRVTTNESNITSIDSRVTTAEANIATNTSDITALEDKNSYDYQKITSFTVTGSTYEEITRLTTTSRSAGTYKLDLSMLSSLNSTTTSAFFRFSLDGGTTWVEVEREPKNTTDVIPLNYFTTIGHTGGVFECIVQGRKEVAGDVLTVHTLDISFDRKL